MKFAIEIKMTVELEVENITDAKVIRNLAHYHNKMDLIMDDKNFEEASKHQRLLDQLKADKALLLRYGKLLALFEALTNLEETNCIGKIADEMHEIEISLTTRLDGKDARWFQDVIKQKLWGERTEHFRNAFRVTVSKPQVMIG